MLPLSLFNFRFGRFKVVQLKKPGESSGVQLMKSSEKSSTVWNILNGWIQPE